MFGLNAVSLALEGLRLNAIVIAALKYRLSDHLVQGPATVNDLAARAGLSPRGVQALADGMVALKLWAVENGRYGNTELSAELLVSGRPGYVGDEQPALFFAWLEAFSSLDEVLRTGQPAPSFSGERLTKFWSLLTPVIAGSLRRIAEEVVRKAALAEGEMDLLDIGGGAEALYATAVLGSNPRARATQLDLPHINDVARKTIVQAGLAERFDVLNGDYRDWVPPPSRFDIVVLSNILHVEGPETAADVCRKAFEALRPGGRLLISEWVVDEGRTGPSSALILNLTMLFLTQRGRSYARSELQAMLQSVGFSEVQFETVEVTPRVVLAIATKRS